MKKAVLTLAILVIATACATYPTAEDIRRQNDAAKKNNEAMQSWVGKTEHALLLMWGPPAERTSDGAGGSILTYRYHVDLGSSSGAVQHWGFYNSSGQWVSLGDTYQAPQQYGYDRLRIFYVSADGTIYTWKWQGL